MSPTDVLGPGPRARACLHMLGTKRAKRLLSSEPLYRRWGIHFMCVRCRWMLSMVVGRWSTLPFIIVLLWVNTILESPDNGLYPFPFSLFEFPHICKASIIKSTASVLVSQRRGCGGGPLIRCLQQCSEVSSNSLARSVVKCDITAQYSTVQHNTALHTWVTTSDGAQLWN